MSIRCCLSLLFLASTILAARNSSNALQEYVVRKDVLAGFKGREYSVYDSTAQHEFYRLESNYGLFQNIEITANPAKQVVARLKAKLSFLRYKAEISILDAKSDRWIDGEIQQKYGFTVVTFNIDWNGERVTLKSEPWSLTRKFTDSDGKVLAQFRVRLSSVLWAKKFDLKIFSKEFPEQLYFLGLAVYDHVTASEEERIASLDRNLSELFLSFLNISSRRTSAPAHSFNVPSDRCIVRIVGLCTLAPSSFEMIRALENYAYWSLAHIDIF